MLRLLTRAGWLVVAAAAQLHCRASPENLAGDAQTVATAVDRLLERHRPYSLLLSSAEPPSCSLSAEPDSGHIASFACGPKASQAELTRDASELAIALRQLLEREASTETLRAA